MLILNQIDKILVIFCLHNENITAMFKPIPNSKIRIHLALFQRNAIKFLQYYNTKQCKNSGSFQLIQWLLGTRTEFETFRISCNPFDYLPQPTLTTPINTIPQHDHIKDFMRDVKKDAKLFP